MLLFTRLTSIPFCSAFLYIEPTGSKQGASRKQNSQWHMASKVMAYQWQETIQQWMVACHFCMLRIFIPYPKSG